MLDCSRDVQHNRKANNIRSPLHPRKLSSTLMLLCETSVFDKFQSPHSLHEESREANRKPEQLTNSWRQQLHEIECVNSLFCGPPSPQRTRRALELLKLRCGLKEEVLKRRRSNGQSKNNFIPNLQYSLRDERFQPNS